MRLSWEPTIVLSESWRQSTSSNRGAVVLHTCVVRTSGSRRNVCRDTAWRWRNLVCRYSLGTWSRVGTQMTAGIKECASSCLQPIPDGIFCYNDPVAIGAMKAIFEAGLNVPDDISVVGAGNVHYSD